LCRTARVKQHHHLQDETVLGRPKPIPTLTVLRLTSLPVQTMEGQTTQLADARPKLDCPLRVALPVNAPERAASTPKDKFIYENAFSPSAIAASKKRQSALCKNYVELSFLDTAKDTPRTHNVAPVNMDHDALIKTAIRDFSVLALSSKRAGNKDVEATAYASLGVIHDNQRHYVEAIESYKLYLQICEDIKDAIGSAAACNCIGVNYMLLANPPSDAGCLHGIKLSPETTQLLEKAVHYHSRHLEIGPDAGGRFVANTNLGLCLGMLDNVNQSAKHHQDSLRVAIKMQTLYGQSIAVGNLGMLALVKMDFSTARTCFDQHLQLVQALIDPEAEIEAWKMVRSQRSHFGLWWCCNMGSSSAAGESFDRAGESSRGPGELRASSPDRRTRAAPQ
jgi:tetratricopeptide (TPR) repeat protein